MLGKRRAGSLIFGLVVFVGTAIADSNAELRRAHTAFHQALRVADAASLDRLLDEHFTWTHTDGLVQSKTDLLKKIRDGQLRYSELSTDQESFNEYAKAAVVTGHSARRYADAAKPFELRYTLTFVKTGHDWKVAAYHTTIFTPGVGYPLQVRLGYPRDAKLLILNADDLAVSHSEDVASFAALDQKLITSATVMVPCPWFLEAASWHRRNPQFDLGIHLTLTSEWQHYRWGPLSCRDEGSGLLDDQGYFHGTTADVRRQAKSEAVRIEMRRQIDLGVRSCINPSHVDNHMMVAMCDEFLEIYLQAGRERGIPSFMTRDLGNSPEAREWFRRRGAEWENRGQPVFDHCRVATRRGDAPGPPGFRCGCLRPPARGTLLRAPPPRDRHLGDPERHQRLARSRGRFRGLPPAFIAGPYP